MCDPAGEWLVTNAELKELLQELFPPVELDQRLTATDKRLNARAEATMGQVEEMAKAIMLETGLDSADWDLAVDHAVYLINLMPMSRNLSRDGTGPRPLQEISRWRVSLDECDKRLECSIPAS